MGSAEKMGCVKRSLYAGVCLALLLNLSARFCVGLTDPRDGMVQSLHFLIMFVSQCSDWCLGK